MSAKRYMVVFQHGEDAEKVLDNDGEFFSKSEAHRVATQAVAKGTLPCVAHVVERILSLHGGE